MELVVSIGTTHPWNIAGVGLDVRIGAELGARVATVIAAVSAQDAGGIRALEPVSIDLLEAQLAAIPWNEAGAIRVGALTTPEAVRIVAAAVAAAPALPAVVDPVLAATRGGTFADPPTLAALRDELATLPNVILTPNLAEAGALLGAAPPTGASMLDAASALRARGAAAVLLKGGHLDGSPVDVLASEEGTLSLRDSRIPATMRGTGCTLAMALAIFLAQRVPLIEAVQRARTFVRGKLQHARAFHGLYAAY